MNNERARIPDGMQARFLRFERLYGGRITPAPAKPGFVGGERRNPVLNFDEAGFAGGELWNQVLNSDEVSLAGVGTRSGWPKPPGQVHYLNCDQLCNFCILSIIFF
ncbi:hypothetical protein B0533_03245 [Sedimentibacter sp. SX930]|nr:hypothetical protein B0533_03245 [Sedimentibacter sp. SX930]